MADHSGGIDRRSALTAIGGAGVAAAASGAVLAQDGAGGTGAARRPAGDPMGRGGAGWDAAKGEYILPPLPYPADALEPHIDAQTMALHHDHHHKAYVDGANKALKELGRIRDGQADPGLVKHWTRELSFHGSGHANHMLFWSVMAPPSGGGGRGGAPEGPLAAAIDQGFGSFEQFVAQFKAAANQVEGSGWGWLVYEPTADRLLVLQGEKQQDLTVWGCTPVFGVDVWEHAYYLKYQNRRAEYINAFMNVVNWRRVGELYEGARAARG